MAFRFPCNPYRALFKTSLCPASWRTKSLSIVLKDHSRSSSPSNWTGRVAPHYRPMWSSTPCRPHSPHDAILRWWSHRQTVGTCFDDDQLQQGKQRWLSHSRRKSSTWSGLFYRLSTREFCPSRIFRTPHWQAQQLFHFQKAPRIKRKKLCSLQDGRLPGWCRRGSRQQR